MAFLSDNFPSLGPEDYSILPLALSDTPFVGVVAVSWLNARNRWQLKEIELLLNYVLFSPVNPARMHLTVLYASNLGVS